MELIHYFKREFTILEHELIIHGLLSKGKPVPEVFWTYVVDISKNGMIDIYVAKRDCDNNIRRVAAAVQKDRRYLQSIIDNGMLVMARLKKLQLPNQMSNSQTIAELKRLRAEFIPFGKYIDVTHCIGRANITLRRDEIAQLGRYHDLRKTSYTAFHDLLNKLCMRIAKSKGMKSDGLSYLLFGEIISLLEGKLTPKQADMLQRQRKPRSIVIYNKGKEKVITNNFDKELDKIKRMMVRHGISTELKGQGINHAVVKGVVQILGKRKNISSILPGSIIVTHMTSPAMTPVLKKCRAIVTDDGGILCHAANVAREFGIPAVIGTKAATKVFRDGDIVEVDANRGIVRKIK